MGQGGKAERDAALRDAILRAGGTYRRIYILGFGWLALDPLWLVLLFLIHRGPEVPGWFLWLLGVWFSALPVLGYATFLFLRRARAEIRRLWDPMTSAERAEALVPIGHKATWPGPTEEVMLPFLRRSCILAEVTPAAAPEARGDEPSPYAGPER